MFKAQMMFTLRRKLSLNQKLLSKLLQLKRLSLLQPRKPKLWLKNQKLLNPKLLQQRPKQNKLMLVSKTLKQR
jgi:hypothetical protein